MNTCPYTYGAGTRLSSAYTRGRDGEPCPAYARDLSSQAFRAWQAGAHEFLAGLTDGRPHSSAPGDTTMPARMKRPEFDVWQRKLLRILQAARRQGISKAEAAQLGGCDGATPSERSAYWASFNRVLDWAYRDGDLMRTSDMVAAARAHARAVVGR